MANYVLGETLAGRLKRQLGIQEGNARGILVPRVNPPVPVGRLVRLVLDAPLYACDTVGVAARRILLSSGDACRPRSETVQVADPLGVVRASLLAILNESSGGWYVPAGTLVYATWLPDWTKYEALAFGECPCSSSSDSSSSDSSQSDSSYWSSASESSYWSSSAGSSGGSSGGGSSSGSGGECLPGGDCCTCGTPLTVQVTVTNKCDGISGTDGSHTLVYVGPYWEVTEITTVRRIFRLSLSCNGTPPSQSLSAVLNVTVRLLDGSFIAECIWGGSWPGPYPIDCRAPGMLSSGEFSIP